MKTPKENLFGSSIDNGVEEGEEPEDFERPKMIRPGTRPYLSADVRSSKEAYWGRPSPHTGRAMVDDRVDQRGARDWGGSRDRDGGKWDRDGNRDFTRGYEVARGGLGVRDGGEPRGTRDFFDNVKEKRRQQPVTDNYEVRSEDLPESYRIGLKKPPITELKRNDNLITKEKESKSMKEVKLTNESLTKKDAIKPIKQTSKAIIIDKIDYDPTVAVIDSIPTVGSSTCVIIEESAKDGKESEHQLALVSTDTSHCHSNSSIVEPQNELNTVVSLNEISESKPSIEDEYRLDELRKPVVASLRGAARPRLGKTGRIALLSMDDSEAPNSISEVSPRPNPVQRLSPVNACSRSSPDTSRRYRSRSRSSDARRSRSPDRYRRRDDSRSRSPARRGRSRDQDASYSGYFVKGHRDDRNGRRNNRSYSRSRSRSADSEHDNRKEQKDTVEKQAVVGEGLDGDYMSTAWVTENKGDKKKRRKLQASEKGQLAVANTAPVVHVVPTTESEVISPILAVPLNTPSAANDTAAAQSVVLDGQSSSLSSHTSDTDGNAVDTTQLMCTDKPTTELTVPTAADDPPRASDCIPTTIVDGVGPETNPAAPTPVVDPSQTPEQQAQAMALYQQQYMAWYQQQQMYQQYYQQYYAQQQPVQDPRTVDPAMRRFYGLQDD